MRRLSVALLGALFLTYASTATAVDFPDGLYWGFNAGIAEDEEFCPSTGEAFSPSLPATGFDEITGCDDTNLGWQLYLGYQLNKWLSAEAGYTDLGGSDILLVQDKVRTESYGGTVGLIGTLPWLEKIGIYGVAGAYFWNNEVAIRRTGEDSQKVSDSGTDLYWGGALRFPLTDSIGINMEYKTFQDVGSDKVGKTDYKLYSVGLMFRF